MSGYPVSALSIANITALNSSIVDADIIFRRNIPFGYFVCDGKFPPFADILNIYDIKSIALHK